MATPQGVVTKYPVSSDTEPREGVPMTLRCACLRCGSHLSAVAHRQTLSGMCSTCGSYEIAPLPNRFKRS
jgi:rRNA maturation protein Nop10